jgi:hypothetical protein
MRAHAHPTDLMLTDVVLTPWSEKIREALDAHSLPRS